MPDTTLRLVREFRLAGRGLHGGEQGAVRLRPGTHGDGWRIARRNDARAFVALDPTLAAAEARRCTTLRLPGGLVRTVEHLFAALAGCGVQDVEHEFEGPEVPILDGSARPWVEAIRANATGEARTAGPGRVGGGWRMRTGGATYRVEPAQRLSVAVEIEGPHPRIGRMRAAWGGEVGSFVQEVAPARTFALREEVEALWAAGLARGGSLDCAAVLGPDGPLGGPLRFADEPARHKLLDLVGDLALAGPLPAARITARAPFHEANRMLAAELWRRRAAEER